MGKNAMLFQLDIWLMENTIYLEDGKKATPICFIDEFRVDESSCLDML
jgi:hypothetical protein